NSPEPAFATYTLIFRKTRMFAFGTRRTSPRFSVSRGVGKDEGLAGHQALGVLKSERLPGLVAGDLRQGTVTADVRRVVREQTPKDQSGRTQLQRHRTSFPTGLGAGADNGSSRQASPVSMSMATP